MTDTAHSGELTWADLDPLCAGRASQADAPCPKCGPDCRTPSNRMRKVLRVWFSDDFITYKCARCGISGWAKGSASGGRTVAPHREDRATPDHRDRIELARYLWSRSAPIDGTLAETYLRSRQCFVSSPSLRFLAGRGEHPPAMISRFGLSRDLTGVHLTKIAADGQGKAGTDKDKLMLGPSAGQPIVVHDNPDRTELIIAEGIEDAASLALATGWSAWAAGSAGRIAAVVGLASSFGKVFVSADRDRAGRRALDDARKLRPDLIPLRVWKALPLRAATDPNKAMTLYGADALLATIEWCETQAAFGRGEMGFEALQRETARAAGIFKDIIDAADEAAQQSKVLAAA